MAVGHPQRPPLAPARLTGSNTFVHGQPQRSAKPSMSRRNTRKKKPTRKRRVGKMPTTMRRNHTVKHGQKGGVARGTKKGDYGRQTSNYTSSSPFMPLSRGSGMMRPRGSKKPRTKQGARRSGEIGGM